MKFSFKRFLSSALAAVMTVSVLSVGMVSSVSAATSSYLASSMSVTSNAKLKELFDGTMTSDKSIEVADLSPAVSSITPLSDTEVGNVVTKEQLTRVFVPSGSKGTITISAAEKSTVGIYYFMSDSSGFSKPKADTISVDGAATGASTTADAGKAFYYEAVVGSSGQITFKGDSQRLFILGFTITENTTPQDTYTITGTVSGLEANDKFTLGKYTATVDAGGTTYTVKESVDKDSAAPFKANDTLEASKPEYNVNGAATATVTLSGSGKDLTATPPLTFVPAVTYQTAIPTDSGYTFTGEGRLPLKADANGGAYAKDDSATLTNHIQISEGKAKLVDQSATTTTMYLPLTKKISETTTGKVVIDGSFSEFASIGGKWNVLNFEDSEGKSIIDLRIAGDDIHNDADTSKKYFSLAIDSGFKSTDGKNTTLYNYYPTDVECANNGNHTYTVTFDYEAKTITLAIDKSHTVTVTSDEENSLSTMGGVGTIVAMTAGSNPREFALGNITISTGEAKTTAETKAIIAGGDDYYATDAAKGNTYIIHPVTEGELAYNSLSLEGTEINTKIVYNAVQFADGSKISATEVGATSLFAICVTGTNGVAPSSDVFKWANK